MEAEMKDRNSSRQNARDAGTRLVGGHPSEDPFAAAFKATRMPMIITDPRQDDNPIIFCNKAFNELSGYSNEELIGQNCRLLQGEETDRETVSKIRRAIAAHENVAVDILNYRKNGSTFWNALFVSPVMDATGEVIYFFASQLDFTNIKSKEAELASARHFAEEEVECRTRDLTEALRAKTMLVHEVDHRVKNNLLTIASIVKLQAKMTEDETVRKTLRSVLNRVEALSTVQRKLFTAEDVGRFDVAEFANELVLDLVSSLKRDDIKFTTDLGEVLVPASKASALALIVNEVVGDAVRRGLSDGGGEIHLEVRRLNGHFIFRVTDTVTPVKVNSEDAAFGKLMLETCARQLDATIEREIDGHSTDVRVTMMVDDKEHA
jgi:PAS domain S-box-containing protein